MVLHEFRRRSNSGRAKLELPIAIVLAIFLSKLYPTRRTGTIMAWSFKLVPTVGMAVFNAAYSWSKAMDNASQVNFSIIPTSLFTQIYCLQFYGSANPSVFGIGNNERFKVQGINPPSPSSFPPSLNTLLNAGLTTTGQGQFMRRHTTPAGPNELP